MNEKLMRILGPLANEYKTRSNKSSNVLMRTLIETNLLIVKELEEIKEVLTAKEEGAKEEDKPSKLRREKKE